MKKLIYILIIALISSCTTYQKCNEKYPCLTTSDTITKEIIKDTTVFAPPDFASLEALLKCDSNGQILLKLLNQNQGIKTKIIYRLKDNIIRVDCKVDSMAIYMQFKIRETTITTNKVQVLPCEETNWQRSLKWIFWIVVAIGIIYIASILYRSFKK